MGVEPTPDNARRVWQALAAFGAPLATLNVHESDFVTPNVVAQFGLPPYRVDLMTAISGVGFAEAWEARLQGTLFGATVGFLGRGDFIRNKRATGRPKDLLDVEALTH